MLAMVNFCTDSKLSGPRQPYSFSISSTSVVIVVHKVGDGYWVARVKHAVRVQMKRCGELQVINAIRCDGLLIQAGFLCGSVLV